MNNANYVLTDIVDRNAFAPNTRHKVAFRFQDESLTFEQLQHSYRRVAGHLQKLGISKGDRVALYLGNRLEWIELFFAIAAIGAISVPLNVMLRGRDVEQILAKNPMTMLIIDDETSPEVGDIHSLPEHVVLVGQQRRHLTGTELTLFNTFESQCELSAVKSAEPDEVAMMYFTSGTTGEPKAVQHTHAGILWNTLHQISDLGLTSNERFLVVPSLSWAAGLHHVTLSITWLGAENTLLASGANSLERIIEEVERVNISRALLVPTLLNGLLRRTDFTARLAASPLRHVTSGAEPLYVETIRALSSSLPNIQVSQCYGMTEFPLIVTSSSAADTIERPGTSGRASSIVTLGIINDQGDVVPQGQGEVVFRSPATTIGYFNAPTKNAESFQDGWFRTGDVGRIDREGYLTIVGRTKELIISGGLNISPQEIESVLNRIPEVIESAVVGRPDSHWGEIPVAVVVVDKVADVSADKILTYCREHLSSFKAPKCAIVRDDPLPRTVTGKVLKRQIVAGAQP